MTESIKTCFSKYAVFSGRAQRSEFWWFFLFSAVSSAIASIVPVIGQIYLLVLLIPSLAVSARRLHDTGRSAWWLLLYLASILAMGIAFAAILVLLIEPERPNDYEALMIFAWIAMVSFFIALGCSLVLLILCVLPGTVGPNRYGPDPLHPELEVGSVGEAARYSAPLDPMSRPGPEGTLFCSQCGTRVPGDSGFCPSCGTAV